MVTSGLDILNKKLQSMEFAFQPIVDVQTGECYGYEAILFNCKKAGFQRPGAFFDWAHEHGMLDKAELGVQKKAMEKFAGYLKHGDMKLFMSLDKRVFSHGNYRPEMTQNLLNRFELPHDSICLEISERSRPDNMNGMVKMLAECRSLGFKIAMDGYGEGGADLLTLYHTEPNFIKISPFFIRNIHKDSKKKLFAKSLTEVAHYMGCTVIARGVDSREEYRVCRDLGCGLIQGDFVQKATVRWNRFQKDYRRIQFFNKNDKDKTEDHVLVWKKIEKIEPILNTTSIFDVFKKFKQKEERAFIPVINRGKEPLGIVRENSFKDYTYSRYGNELLQNPSFGGSLGKFITKFPMADIRMPTEKILEIYSRNEDIEGIIITNRMKYIGVLSAPSLLKILNEKSVTAARDQNPLSKLPGNTLVYDYIKKTMKDTGAYGFLTFFDFNNFKSYNDKYGFQQGDRLILLFSEMLKKNLHSSNRFIGHIEGDDFFMGSSEVLTDDIYKNISEFLAKFNRDAQSFYDEIAIRKGYINSWGSDGKIKAYPLLTASAVILEIPPKRYRIHTTREISNAAQKLREEARKSPDRISRAVISDVIRSAHQSKAS